MPDLFILTCPFCGGKLQITNDLDQFACVNCGNELIVKRSGGTISLVPIVEGQMNGIIEPGNNHIHGPNLKFGPANHKKGLEYVGGSLLLTSKQLNFKSHNFNLQNHEEKFPLNEIRSIKRCNTLGVVPNGFSIKLVDGREEKFVVNGRDEWIRQIVKANPDIKY